MHVFGECGGDHAVVAPLAMSVGWVISDRSADAERPQRLIALTWVRKVLTVIFASLSSVRSSRRSTNARAARLPISSRLKNRNSLGSFRVRVAPQRVVTGCTGDFVDACSACGSGSGEDQFADEFRMFGHQRLGDHPAEGEGEDVDGVETECGDEV